MSWNTMGLIGLVLLCGCYIGSAQSKDTPTGKEKPAAADEKKDELKLTEDEQALLDLTNAERKKADLPPLTANAKLFEAARGHAANMAKQNKLDHTLDDKTLVDRLKAVGYKAMRGGENIGAKQQNPKEAVQAWMNSKLHKENLLTKEFTEVGLAVARSANGDRYWIQVFGTPLP